MEIRPFAACDADGIRTLAPRLTEGVARWRDPEAVRTAVGAWVEGSIDAAVEDGHGVYVAVDDGYVLGFVSVTTTTHWTGDTDAYVGELVVASDADGRGIGSALLARAEQWASERGLARLQLETGAANERAIGFYEAHGYAAEDVRLSRPIGPEA